jgi:hypothetical protein
MGKFLVIVGIIIVLIGLGLHYGVRIPWIGKLPGDILIQRENFTFYFPLTTGILLSLIIIGILYIVRKINGG